MKIRFKKLSPNAVTPSRAHSSDAGFDLTATSLVFDREGNATYGFGIAVEIPDGYVGLVFPRSSISKKDLILSNSVGVIDSGYRGEIMAKFKPALLYVDNPPLPSATTNSIDPQGGTDQTDIRTQSVEFYGKYSASFDFYLRWYNRDIPFDYDGYHDSIDPLYTVGRVPNTLNPRVYGIGDRVAQLIILKLPEIELEEATELTPSDRGEGGYGSTGK